MRVVNSSLGRCSMSLYEGSMPQEEVDRLLTHDYPLLISSRILDRLGLAGRTLLDVGAGANPGLALFTHASGAQYQGMDKNQSMVEQLRTQLSTHRLPFRVDLGDVLSLDPA